MQTPIDTYKKMSEDYDLIERALIYLEQHQQEQPNLQMVAERMGYSEYHFQRLFTRWVGISPKRFLQFLSKEYAKQCLLESISVNAVAFQTGLSSPGRLHDLLVTCEAVTPGEYKSRGAGISIVYGFHPTPFGECLLALTQRGICRLSFIQNGAHRLALQDLQKNWQNADIKEDPATTQPVLEQIFPASRETLRPIPLLLNGTNFQIQVWEALVRIPPGRLANYEQVAKTIGRPTSCRAVGNAVGDNPIAYLIPCHRVIRKMGVFGNYRYGPARKKAILGWEFAHLADGAA